MARTNTIAIPSVFCSAPSSSLPPLHLLLSLSSYSFLLLFVQPSFIHASRAGLALVPESPWRPHGDDHSQVWPPPLLLRTALVQVYQLVLFFFAPSHPLLCLPLSPPSPLPLLSSHPFHALFSVLPRIQSLPLLFFGTFPDGLPFFEA